MAILGEAMWSSHLLMVSSELLMVAPPMAVRIVAMEMLAANLGMVAPALAMLNAEFLDRSPHLLGSTLARWKVESGKWKVEKRREPRSLQAQRAGTR
jgi:hypothetical protein